MDFFNDYMDDPLALIVVDIGELVTVMKYNICHNTVLKWPTDHP